MKTALALPVSLLFLVSAQAAELSLQSGSRLWLEGTSTLHAFSSTATVLEAAARLPEDGASLEKSIREHRATGFVLTVPVRGLKSGERGLDKNLYRALKAEKNPEIIFRLRDYEIQPDSGPVREIKANGSLEIAGVERNVPIDARARFTGSGVTVQGSRDLLMTDFGVQPPALMFGALKTGNRVVVRFELRLSPRSEIGASRREQP